MKKVMTLGLFLALLVSPLAHAEAVVDTGNLTCPVSGDKVSGKDFVEHEGKKYGLCCKMCVDKFNKNPEKYLTEMAESAKEDHSGHNH